MTFDGADSDTVQDTVISQWDVVVRASPPHQQLFRVQFPPRKTAPFDALSMQARFKKHVNMLELRMQTDTDTGSFDRGKAEHLASLTARPLAGALMTNTLDHETYLGHSHPSNRPLYYAVGTLCNGVLFVSALQGCMEMKRSLKHVNDRQAAATEDDESDNEQTTAAPVRVRFSRPENERQKKRREESSLHRSRLIELDPWLELALHKQQDTITQQRRRGLAMPPLCTVTLSDAPLAEDLVQKSALHEELARLDVSNCDQLISLRGLSQLHDEQQLQAVLIKAGLLTTDEALSYLRGSMSRDHLLLAIQQWAHLVNGVWVIKSELLYPSELRTVWRSARDLALCHISFGWPVTRKELGGRFGLGSHDVESILNTFAVLDVRSEHRSWTLRVAADDGFGQRLAELRVLLSERRYWHKRWLQIHRYVNAQQARTSRRPNARRRSSSGSGKPRTNSTRTVLID